MWYDPVRSGAVDLSAGSKKLIDVSFFHQKPEIRTTHKVRRWLRGEDS
jgi:hypothetical protein